MMRSVKRQNTKPELAVRAELRNLGIHGRYNVRTLPGTPDIASKKGKWAIFVHGCFWHGHSKCRKTKSGDTARLPVANRASWAEKFERNQARDRKKLRDLRRLGFRVLTLWECQVGNERRLTTALLRFFDKTSIDYVGSPTDPMTTAVTRLRVAGLFAGIGGLELGLSLAGHENVMLCEIDPGAKAVLKTRFPESPLVDDVNDVTVLPRGTSLLVAGFPCQDLSQAGATKGISGSQSGLVDHVFRIAKLNKVEWLLLENVSFMLQLGGGAAMRHVTNKLTESGYRWAYRIVNSLAFGVPQRRERVYILASRHNDPAPILFHDDTGPMSMADWRGKACGFYWTEGLRGLGWAIDCVPTLKGGSTLGIPSPPAIWMPDGSFVTPDIRDAERLQGFSPDWTLPAESVSRASHRWKLVGNAVTVGVAEWLGRQLMNRPTEFQATVLPMSEIVHWPRAGFCDDHEFHAVDVSAWPVRLARPSLVEFLEFRPKPLSYKALSGFYGRLTRGNLKRPVEFDGDIQRTLGVGPSSQISLAFASGD